MNIHTPKVIISIVIIWLFTSVAIIGFFIGYRAGFTLLIPMNILIWALFIIWHTNSKQTFLPLFIIFSMGLGVRILSLRYEWVMGAYQYGETMSYKIFGTPIISGFTWVTFGYSTAAIAKRITTHILGSSLVATFLAVGLHLLFSISAPKLDLWKFKHGGVSLKYVVMISSIVFLLQLFLQKKIKLFHFEISIHIFLTMFIFAISMLFL